MDDGKACWHGEVTSGRQWLWASRGRGRGCVGHGVEGARERAGGSVRCRVDRGDTEEAFAASKQWPSDADGQGGGVASSGACAVSLLCLLAEVGDD